MPLLFSYGTLQQDDVQLATFGRRLTGERDELARFEPSSVPIEDPHLAATSGRTHNVNVKFNGNEDSRVPGTVFEITEGERVIVRKILVRGNRSTHEGVIMRRVALYEGQPYRTSDVRKTQERVSTLGTFSSVSVALGATEMPFP